jgi:hypothetical protein
MVVICRRKRCLTLSNMYLMVAQSSSGGAWWYYSRCCGESTPDRPGTELYSGEHELVFSRGMARMQRSL